ncbi:MAG: DTW domain-containing protein [Spirochaetia bacterium]|nr:DTW domain-containing protein [Spirochaetia bacterium]
MRETCPRCRRPVPHCLCALVPPMECRTKLVVLMHPHEVKHVKANTGRLAALSFEDAEILVGVDFDGHARLRELLSDAAFVPMLLYPGEGSRNLSEGGLSPEDLGGRRLLVILLDATWPLARKMLRLSPSLQALPRLMFTPRERSRWVIKRQPHELCLSTLEAVHELMAALDSAGLDRYERPGQLLAAFEAVQALQVARAADPLSPGYRRNPGRAKSVREAFESGRTAEIRPKSRGLFYKDPARKEP